MKGYIDLGVLAILAGWELYSKEITTMGEGDMNEAVPVVIRLLPKKANKSRKKKISGCVQTYDEQVEGRDSVELDLDLEMEFF